MERNRVGSLGNCKISLHGLAALNLYTNVTVFTKMSITLSNGEGISINPRVAKISPFIDFKVFINKFDKIT